MGRTARALGSWLAAAVVAAAGCGRLAYSPVGGDGSSSRADGTAEGGVPAGSVVVINDGAAAAIAPVLRVTITLPAGTTAMLARVEQADASGDCQARYADDRWEPYTAPSTIYERWVQPTEGTKKLCLWTKDASGNVGVISPATGTLGVDMDTIEYQTANLPVVEMLSVVNDANGTRSYAPGDAVRVSFVVTDAEALATDPIDLYYTTESAEAEAWTPIVTGFGGLIGEPTRHEGSYTGFTAPAGPFRVKIVARDAAGNLGVPVLSDVQNAAGWGVYAGSADRGIGSVARAATMQSYAFRNSSFAISPITNDMFVTDENHGVIRVDARTGLVERFLHHGTPNLPDDGPLPERPTISIGATLGFDPAGRLYVGGREGPSDPTMSARIHQIDLATRRCRKYVGGGMANDATATPDTAFTFTTFAIDEAGALYFLTSCSPGSWDSATAALRMLKVAQNADGTPGAISIVAGDCTRGDPGDGPSDPLASPLLGNFQGNSIGSIVVWDRGARIYYAFYGTGTWKIVDGQLYASDIVTSNGGSLAYNPVTGTLYAADSSITEHVPNVAGPRGDTLVRTVVASSGTGPCAHDGVLATEACVNQHRTMRVDARGTLYFRDSGNINSLRHERIRFVDDSGRLRTYVGSLPFHGGSLDRRVVRGWFGGIHWKDAGAPNQAAFPAGLYFVDGRAIVFGHVDATTDRLAVLWGNQGESARVYEAGSAIGPELSLGVSYAGGNLWPLAFDAMGLPWLRYGPDSNRALLLRLDASRRVVQLQSGYDDWETAADGTDPAAYELWPYGFLGNLALDGERAFLINGYTGSRVTTAMIKMFDFGARTVTQIMGGTRDGFTPDSATPGSVRTASLWSGCHNNHMNCFVAHRADQDRLYFSEDSRLRFVTAPANPAASTLATLFEQPAGRTIRSFTFRPDGAQVFYQSDGSLYCHDLGSGAAWCDDTPLGPPPILSALSPGPNQFTWRDERTLLISSYDGEIYEYVLPP